jgi:SAM-dependent methyltransferase
MTDRKERERAFHDARFGAPVARAADRFYAIAGASKARYREEIERRSAGADVLEYGCGPGSEAFDLAARGARVTGIDISPVAIEIAREEARERNLTAEFHVMDAENVALPDRSFDLVCGSGILHHLDLERSYAELARLLRPAGAAIFAEPMGHNPLINWYRQRTPDMRTADEHPMLEADFALARRYFASVDVAYFHLATLAALPVCGKPGSAALVNALDGIDRLLFKALPPLRRHAWYAVIVMSRPRTAFVVEDNNRLQGTAAT